MGRGSHSRCCVSNSGFCLRPEPSRKLEPGLPCSPELLVGIRASEPWGLPREAQRSWVCYSVRQGSQCSHPSPLPAGSGSRGASAFCGGGAGQPLGADGQGVGERWCVCD